MKNLSPINPTRITNASLQANYDSNIENIDFTLFYHYIYLYMQSAQNEAEVSCVINKASLFMNASILSKHNQEQNIRQSRSDEIYYKFIYYVRQFAPAKHHISFYSGKLCISSQYLSTIVKEVSGKTARVWIDDFIILEAKILLEHTNLTIQEVGNRMNFADQSSFGKFFKKKVGLSPKKYASSVRAKVIYPDV